MRWDEIKVGDVVRVPKGTRRGPSTFEVTRVEANKFLLGQTEVTGTTFGSPKTWVYFNKWNDFSAFSVKGEAEFVNGEDD